VAFAGNALLTCPENNPPSRHRAKRRRGLRVGQDSSACINASNNDHNMVYVNVDSSGGHFDSSSATLTVPSGARVVKAFLYWGADLSEGVNRPTTNPPSYAAPGGADPNTNTQWKKADLRVGSGSYTTIDATAADRNGDWKGIASWYNQPGQDPGFAYQVRSDVTSEVNAGLTATRRRARSARADPLTVTVANVQAGHGYNRHGGWNLLVVWQTPTAAYRDITIFDGFDFVQVQGGEQLVVGPLNFTGFSTPASGKVDAHVTTWTYEGDRGITGDYMALGPVSDTCGAQTRLSDLLHPVGNFFNSAISRGGVDDGDRTPDYSNQLGFDLATVKVPEDTIGNAADGASVCLGTNGDTYFFGGIVFDTLIRAPNVQINKVANVSQAAPGDPVRYTTTVTNPQRSTDDPLYPTAAATNLVVADPLPSGIDFAGFVGTPPCIYNGAKRSISCDVGTLPADGAFTYSFNATVHASAQGPAPNPVVNTGCFVSNSEDQPSVIFTGCDDATIIVPPLPPPQPQPADLGVVKTVSVHTVAPGDTITWKVVGTNYGPATSTTFVLADQLPAGVSFVSVTASGALTCTTPPVGGNGAVTCTAPSVPVKPADGSSLTLTIVATVPAGTADGTLLINVATVHGDQNEPAPDPHPNRDVALTRVVVPGQPLPPPPVPPSPDPAGPPAPPVPQPDEPATAAVLGTRLSLHKRATPRLVHAGATVTFALRVRNIAEDSALNVRVCDRLPHGLTVASAPGFMLRGRTLCKAIGTLKVLTAKTLRFTVRVGSKAALRTTNTATADARNSRTVRARATIRVLPSPPPPAVTG
jgi:large repetitive protein